MASRSPEYRSSDTGSGGQVYLSPEDHLPQQRALQEGFSLPALERGDGPWAWLGGHPTTTAFSIMVVAATSGTRPQGVLRIHVSTGSGQSPYASP